MKTTVTLWHCTLLLLAAGIGVGCVADAHGADEADVDKWGDTEWPQLDEVRCTGEHVALRDCFSTGDSLPRGLSLDRGEPAVSHYAGTLEDQCYEDVACEAREGRGTHFEVYCTGTWNTRVGTDSCTPSSEPEVWRIDERSEALDAGAHRRLRTDLLAPGTYSFWMIGRGDADLYVRVGAEPHLNVRPEISSSYCGWEHHHTGVERCIVEVVDEPAEVHVLISAREYVAYDLYVDGALPYHGLTFEGALEGEPVYRPLATHVPAGEYVVELTGSPELELFVSTGARPTWWESGTPPWWSTDRATRQDSPHACRPDGGSDEARGFCVLDLPTNQTVYFDVFATRAADYELTLLPVER
ncbi:MAG: hypothetical protein JRH11_04840 [Deltaproteobacteria bacterium]|nr:hypothetical protein [Deltaproteobacteria bacterium]